jgi:hypothetical protein
VERRSGKVERCKVEGGKCKIESVINLQNKVITNKLEYTTNDETTLFPSPWERVRERSLISNLNKPTPLSQHSFPLLP